MSANYLRYSERFSYSEEAVRRHSHHITMSCSTLHNLRAAPSSANAYPNVLVPAQKLNLIVLSLKEIDVHSSIGAECEFCHEVHFNCRLAGPYTHDSR